jgi:hypothetical protein
VTETDTRSEVDRRSTLGWLALAAAAISALGLIILLIGIAFDIEGAREGEEGPVIFSIAWVSYLIGGLGALVLGGIAYATGRSRNDAATKQSGLIALAYAAIAVVVFVVAVVS